MQMTNNEALAIVREACSTFTGVLADHQKIQAALTVIESSLPKRQRKQTAKQGQ
jgi:hypothetical protein